MQQFEVGKPLKEGKTKYAEGTKFEFEQSGAVLYVFYKSPTQREVDAFRSGDIKLGMFYKSGTIFMLFKFGSLNWIDAPYTVHLSQPYTFQPLGPGTGFGMTLIFIDAGTGIVKVLKQIGWPYRMSLFFQRLVDGQFDLPFDKATYDANVMEVYCNYSTDDMVRMGDIFRLREGK